MFLNRYTDEELTGLIWYNSVDSELLKVVKRSVAVVQFGSFEYWIIVKDTLTDKHYRIHFGRSGDDFVGYTYMVYPKITEVYEKEVMIKVWEDFKLES